MFNSHLPSKVLSLCLLTGCFTPIIITWPWGIMYLSILLTVREAGIHVMFISLRSISNEVHFHKQECSMEHACHLHMQSKTVKCDAQTDNWKVNPLFQPDYADDTKKMWEKHDTNLYKCLISPLTNSMHCGTHIVQHTHHTYWLLALNEITHNLVVEVIYGRPFNSFLDILFLGK